MSDYNYPHSHQECPTCLMLSERAERAEAAIVAALDEPKATKILCLRIEELNAKAERIDAALSEWRKHDSAPDCVACAALDAALAGGGE